MHTDKHTYIYRFENVYCISGSMLIKYFYAKPSV